MADNMEIFEEFYESIKNAECVEDVLCEWGGINILVPAFVGALRDRIIYKEYKELTNMSESYKYLVLAKKFNLSQRKVREAVSSHKGEVGLFQNTDEE